MVTAYDAVAGMGRMGGGTLAISGSGGSGADLGGPSEAFSRLLGEQRRGAQGLDGRVHGGADGARGDDPGAAAGDSAEAGAGAERAALKAREQARQAAEELVAIAFVQPLLKQMRAGQFAWGPAASGVHEETLAPLADAAIAERIVRAQRLPIVDALAKSFEERAAVR